VAVHLQLIENIDREKCRVSIVTNTRASDFHKTMIRLRKVDGISIIPMDLGFETAGRGKAGKISGILVNLFIFVKMLFLLSQYVRKEKVDVLHTTDRPRDALAATLLARVTNAKEIVHCHIKWYPEIGGITNWALKQCDCILAISHFVKRSLIEGGFSEEKIKVVWNSTDIGIFHPDKVQRGSFRAKHGINPVTPLIGIAARIMVWKGHLELVEAFEIVRKQISDACLVIVGEEDHFASISAESYKEKVKTRAQELGIAECILWTGWGNDIPAVFADLDVICVPSWEEPFGLVVTEAMSMEKPVVGYNTGALPEIIESGEQGILVPFKDNDAFAMAIIHLLQNPELAREMGHKGRRKVEAAFSPEEQADAIAGIYLQLSSMRSL
jgi:glycosyltransferase involved in cell wall biosynthesis